MALVLVLWVLTILTVMAGSFALEMRREASVIATIKNLAQTTALAEAGIYRAVLGLMQKDSQQRWRADGTVYQFLFANAQLRVRVVDESGRVDLNRSDEPQLLQVLTQAATPLGWSDQQITALADAIFDWRDEDSEPRPNGAELQAYQKAGLRYGPRNGSFNTVEELQWVLGMSNELYQALLPVVTVYSGQQRINLAVAPREVLLTLPDATPQAVEQFLLLRQQNAEAGLPPPDFLGRPAGGQTGNGPFRVFCEARLSEDDPPGRLEAVIRLGRYHDLPLQVLEWGEARLSRDDALFAVDNEQVIDLTTPKR